MIFHGLNAVQKGYPWYPSNLKNMTKLENFRKWGFNVVRLGFMWSGLYPEKNKLDQNYVNEMFDIINDLQSKGMYVIIDLHQDMMSTKFNAYDGVPLWVVDELPDPKHEFPWPFKKKILDFQHTSLMHVVSLLNVCIKIKAILRHIFINIGQRQQNYFQTSHQY